jgi:2-polyprenyl-3-methyl-5-hydroxy-6-metoxy-1,4-benzoquinol methylase
MTRQMETFYTDLHEAMRDIGGAAEAVFPTAREFREFVRARFPNGLSGFVCVDAGCGGNPANTATVLAHGATRVAALDVNRRSLDLARRTIAEKGGASVLFAEASLLALPLRDGCCDLVVCSGVVHHTKDPRQAVRELSRVAKPGATIYLSVYCFEASWALAAVRFWRALAWIVPFRLMHAVFRRVAAVNNFVLDHMYVPTLWVFAASDIETIARDAGLAVEASFRSALDPFGERSVLGRRASGDGLLRVFVCRRS